MSNITMLDIEELKKTRLRPYIEKSLEHRAPDPGFHAIMGHNPDLAESIYKTWITAFNEGTIDHNIKEIIRIQLSQLANCTY